MAPKPSAPKHILRFKCPHCGHRWLVAKIDYDNMKYPETLGCPRCEKTGLSREEHRAGD